VGVEDLILESVILNHLQPIKRKVKLLVLVSNKLFNG